MPELPDIVMYIEALDKRVLGQTLEGARVVSPFLLRTASPPLSSANGKKVLELRRLGKRICVGLENELWLVLHLMIAGRLHWKERKAIQADKGPLRQPPRNQLATFTFTNGILSLTEAGTQR